MMSFLLDQRKNDIFNRFAPQVSGPQQMQRPMAMPSGGPNTGAPMPSAPDGFSVGINGPSSIDEAIAIACGIPPSQINRGPGGNAQNNPMPQMGGGLGQIRLGGGMAPSMPNAVDQGLGTQQMNFGNPMGGMNNWFSNFAAPRPMPAPAPAAPAPMMPMKGMFGVR